MKLVLFNHHGSELISLLIGYNMISETTKDSFNGSGLLIFGLHSAMLFLAELILERIQEINCGAGDQTQVSSIQEMCLYCFLDPWALDFLVLVSSERC